MSLRKQNAIALTLYAITAIALAIPGLILFLILSSCMLLIHLGRLAYASVRLRKCARWVQRFLLTTLLGSVADTGIVLLYVATWVILVLGLMWYMWGGL